MSRTRKTCVILLSGKAGAGKSTAGDMLEKKLLDIPSISVLRYGFADPLKYQAKAYFGWDGKKDDRGRKLLQDIGRIGREYDIDIWVKHFLNQLDKKAGILPFNFSIIDDWRFPNELAYLQKNPLLDIVSIRVFGRGGLNGETANDVSENSLPEADFESLERETSQPYYDFAIDNRDDLELLERKLDLVLAEIEKQYIVE